MILKYHRLTSKIENYRVAQDKWSLILVNDLEQTLV